MIDSANNYKFTQCVACAKAMATTVGRTYIGSGAAKQHAGQKVNGYTYYANKLENYDYLVPGSLGISTEGDNGHIWYIYEVDRDNNGVPISYKAFECNFGYPAGTPQSLIKEKKVGGYVRNDKLRMVNSNYLVGWQKPDNL